MDVNGDGKMDVFAQEDVHIMWKYRSLRLAKGRHELYDSGAIVW